MARLCGVIPMLEIPVEFYDERLGIFFTEEAIVTQVDFEGTYEHEDGYFNHAAGYGDPPYTDWSVTSASSEDTLADIEESFEWVDGPVMMVSCQGCIDDALLEAVNAYLEDHDVEDYVDDEPPEDW